MGEMIERVARAIQTSQGAAPWEERDDPEWYRNEAMAKARAAIEAMREPTPEMKKEGDGCGGFSAYEGDDNTLDIWQAMIAAALSDQNPKPDVAEGIAEVNDTH